jgi:YidC/Oxa1 family membrane protein insertase
MNARLHWLPAVLRLVALAAALLPMLVSAVPQEGAATAPDSPEEVQEASQPSSAPTSTSDSQPTASGPAADQEGLPTELVIDLDKLDEQERALDSLNAYLVSNAPPGGIAGFLSGIGNWISSKLSGTRSARGMTIEAIFAAHEEGADQLNGVFVSVEGLYETGDPNDWLIAGSRRLGLSRLPQTVEDGFGSDGPDGLPAIVTGTVLPQEEGPVLHMGEVKPAPTLTPIRLARIYELRNDPATSHRAVEMYQDAARSRSPTGSPWVGFAMARGGRIADDQLPDARTAQDRGRLRKKAIALYNQAWELEGRVKAGKAPATALPRTWVQQEDGRWTETTLREAVGTRLDALNSEGFWYKFVRTFVIISGNNAGIGLVLMAIITRLLLWPLTRKQIQSSRAMQRLQPQIKALQEKHGKDKQKFQEDFWKLCRQNKVNPFGGCLPLLIQLPVLWMVYRGIRAYTVQLAGHSFLWIGNLADPDLPLLVLYTISMIAFQKLTMKNQPVADPQQQQQQNMMVWMMPIMFFLFFQTIASGFILYWLGTNLIYLPQQYFGTRVAKREAEEDEGEPKDRTITLEPQGAKGNQAAGAASTWLQKLRNLGGSHDEGNGQAAPHSYEEKKREAKKVKRNSSRRRRRRS